MPIEVKAVGNFGLQRQNWVSWMSVWQTSFHLYIICSKCLFIYFCVFYLSKSVKTYAEIQQRFRKLSDFLIVTFCNEEWLYPRHTTYAEGYIVFVYPFVRSYVSSFVRSSVTLVDFTTKIYVKVSQMGTSQQPLIRKHSYLSNRYLGGSDYIP